MQKKITLLVSFIALQLVAFGQHPLKHFTDAIDSRYSRSQPVISYVLNVDSVNYAYFDVKMILRNVPDTFRVALVCHPEYDDRFYRYIENIDVSTNTGKGNIERLDSALWKVRIQSGEAIIRYRIRLPKADTMPRPSWTPFLGPAGGLLGGPHSFLYVVGATLAPSYVTIQVPSGWQIATGLQQTVDPITFYASSVFVLTDSPILTGYLENWSFNVAGVPHRVVYWPLPGTKKIDGEKLVRSVQHLVEQANALFGRQPYRDFTFLFQDNAYGSLEHSNSVTVGIPASQLETDFTDHIGEIAHEYFHTWNMVRIHPAEYGDVNYKKQQLSKGLWFSEGLTMFYADLLLRRAGLPTEDTTRVNHLERLIRRYYNTPGNRLISPEKVSMAEYGAPGMLGDYLANTHSQGEILGTALDFLIRDATKGKKSMDDLMRQMMERYSGEKGFTGKDIETLASAICSCDIHPFFEEHVRGSKPLDINRYLALAGLRYMISWKPVLDEQQKPMADWRIFCNEDPNGNGLQLIMRDPDGCWGRAGLHTGDRVISINGIAVKSSNAFYSIIRSAQIGNIVKMEVQQKSGLHKIDVTVSGFLQAVVKIEMLETAKNNDLLKNWSSGN